ncbi:MAG TPA: polysaccharide biosynthesis/export family protein [Xanthobacteraceae bacterium]|nr:polysaccharide biosynthesis/export family protein [Xanthobacteraceae bacterium]
MDNKARIAALALAGSIALAAGGCTITPAAGPYTVSVVTGVSTEPETLPYSLVKLTPENLAILAANRPKFGRIFTSRPGPSEIRFGVGDVVSVTIFEASAGGLFIPIEAGVRPGNFITLPNQLVDNAGNISVPYAGSIQAKGRTPVEVQQSIVEALRNRAIEPQAVVSLVEQRTSLISVLGDVNNPSRFPAAMAGERILDAIARAGGPKSQGFDTWVMLERDGRRATMPFGALIYEPANNIYVRPNDTIYLYREPQTFLAFGALGTTQLGLTNQIPFDQWRLSLAEAVAKAGGLLDFRADPAAVFVYRGEPRKVAELLGADTSKHDGPFIPIVYQVNFRDPAGYFLATQFQMQNKDVIYVSNSVTVETAKLMQWIRAVTATVNDPLIAANNIQIMRDNLRIPLSGTSGP